MTNQDQPQPEAIAKMTQAEFDELAASIEAIHKIEAEKKRLKDREEAAREVLLKHAQNLYVQTGSKTPLPGVTVSNVQKPQLDSEPAQMAWILENPFISAGLVDIEKSAVPALFAYFNQAAAHAALYDAVAEVAKASSNEPLKTAAERAAKALRSMNVEGIFKPSKTACEAAARDGVPVPQVGEIRVTDELRITVKALSKPDALKELIEIIEEGKKDE